MGKDNTKQRQREDRYQLLVEKRRLQPLQHEDQSLELTTDHDKSLDPVGHVDPTNFTTIEELTKDVSTQTAKEAEGRFGKYGSDLVEGDDAKTKFYTGLSSWGVFMHVFTFVVSHK